MFLYLNRNLDKLFIVTPIKTKFCRLVINIQFFMKEENARIKTEGSARKIKFIKFLTYERRVYKT